MPQAFYSRCKTYLTFTFTINCFEKFVYKSLKDVFCSKFKTSQFGFRPDSSTCYALIYLHNFITNSLDDPCIGAVQLLSYDYSKAFDSVSHSIIVDCLSKCNFPDNFIQWILSYLCNRSQSVRIGSSLSTQCSVTSGVPQGSVVGPALFSIVVSGLNVLVAKRLLSNMPMIFV